MLKELVLAATAWARLQRRRPARGTGDAQGLASSFVVVAEDRWIAEDGGADAAQPRRVRIVRQSLQQCNRHNVLALLTGVDVVGARAGTKIGVDVVASDGEELRHDFDDRLEMLVQRCLAVRFGRGRW